MTITVKENLKEQGWYLSDHGYNLLTDSDNILDVQRIIKRAIDYDLREICNGVTDLNEANIVLQIQKIRNVAAPKNNEESRSAPRMLKLSLTDGKNNYQAVEVEHISFLSLNTPPGTKLLVNAGNLCAFHGIILLKPTHISQVLGGKVTSLVEKWELNKKLASHSRVRSAEEGGPPPWIPFGKKIIKVTDNDKNFKALGDKDKASKENTEFEAQRKDAIAEAAKQGNKKVFGGGNKQLLDHSVQRIVDQGFSIEQAEYALKINRNNVDKALKSLQRNESRNNPKETREPRNKRFEKKSEESKPSSGKISLFDFLEDKLPVQSEPIETNYSSQNSHFQQHDNTFDRLESRHNEMPSGKGGRTLKGGRGYQGPPRHVEENKNSRRASNSNNTTEYNGGNASQSQNKPPRFQRNHDFKESHNNHYQQNNVNKAGFQKPNNYQNNFKTTSNQPRSDGGRNSENYNKNPYEQQSRNFSNKSYDSDTGYKTTPNTSYGRHNRTTQEGTYKTYNNAPDNKNYKNQFYKHQSVSSNDATVPNGKETMSFHKVQRNENLYSNDHNVPNVFSSNGSSWTWQVGDKCMAKYWEDNRYYNAVVTGVSERTCVVQFKGFENFEEVLQIDCLPISEDDQNAHEYGTDRKRQDQRYNNRSARHDQGHNAISGMEFRRGGTSASAGNKAYGKRKGPQRSSQPIYQPPAQRNHDSISTNPYNTPNNSNLQTTKKNFL